MVTFACTHMPTGRHAGLTVRCLNSSIHQETSAHKCPRLPGTHSVLQIAGKDMRSLVCNMK
jgi:hypothetical protein